jgi:hypothetical protein
MMAAVANQVHSTAQQIGVRIGGNPIDAATQPPTGTRERVLNLSDPRTDHRNLGFEDSCISGAPPSLRRLPLLHGRRSLDHGPGRGTKFNSEEVANPTTPENLLFTHVRGTYLMKRVVDEVSFEDGGSVVRMRKNSNGYIERV